jgi:hypothetical protein
VEEKETGVFLWEQSLELLVPEEESLIDRNWRFEF